MGTAPAGAIDYGVEVARKGRDVRTGHVARAVAAVAIVTCSTRGGTQFHPEPDGSRRPLNFSNVPTYGVSTAAVGLPARFPPLTPAALRSARESTTPTLGLRTCLINVERAPFQVRAIQSRNCPIRFCRVRHLYESETA